MLPNVEMPQNTHTELQTDKHFKLRHKQNRAQSYEHCRKGKSMIHIFKSFFEWLPDYKGLYLKAWPIIQCLYRNVNMSEAMKSGKSNVMNVLNVKSGNTKVVCQSGQWAFIAFTHNKNIY